MSLDFYLNDTIKKSRICICECCNNEHEEEYFEILFHGNITHNLGEMATEAKIYDCLWRPEENGYQYASDIIDVLEKGLEDLLKRPEHFKKFNSPNGYGIYPNFVKFVEEALKACKENRHAEIEACR